MLDAAVHDRARMAGESEELLVVRDIPEFDETVPRAPGEAFAVRTEGDSVDAQQVGAEGGQAMTGHDVPHASRAVPTAAGQPGSIRGKIQTRDLAFVSPQ